MKKVPMAGVLLVGAAALHLWSITFRGIHGPVPWAKSAVATPIGLILLAVINIKLKSKVLAWGIFTVAFVLFMIIVGTWVVMDRAMKGPPPSDFLRSVVLYGFLAASALMQLRVASPLKGDSTK